MMRSFVSFPRMVQSILGWDRGERVCVVAGTEDKLMGVALTHKLVGCYREVLTKFATDKKNDLPKNLEIDVHGHDSPSSSMDRGAGVRFVTIKGAGHHLQNDLVWEEGAKQVLHFLEALD